MPTYDKFLLVSTLLLAPAAFAQAPGTTQQSTPAPVVRSYGNSQAAGQPGSRRAMVQVVRPAPGIVARVSADGVLRTVVAGDRTELRLEHGVANISVFHPPTRGELLVDLPNGQTALLKDGLYTFNAQSGTVRVLKGEAEAFASAAADAKNVKVKEDHQVVFAATPLRSVELAPFQARADLLPSPGGEGHPAERRYGGQYYGGGFYGDGFGYPYASDYAYGYGYPGFGYSGFGYGYPGFGFGYGFGYGYRGGFGGRFR